MNDAPPFSKRRRAEWGSLDLVKIIFDEDSHADLWFERDRLWALSANDIKQEAHKIIFSLLEQAQAKAAAEGAGGEHVSTGSPIADNLGGPVEMGEEATEDSVAWQDEPLRSSTINTQPSCCRRRQPRVITGQFLEDLPTTSVAAAASGSHRRVAVHGTAAVVAYRARLLLSSVILHFHGRGLRPGAFLFIAVQDSTWDGRSALVTAECDDDSTMACEMAVEAKYGNGGDDVSYVTRPRISKSELWVTDETAPLLPTLRSRTAAAEAERRAQDSSAEAQSSFASMRSSPDGLKVRPPDGTPGNTAAVVRAAEKERRDGGQEATESRVSLAALTLRLVPSGRAPLPPLSCGLCGSSWQHDPCGRRYVAYHLAVATNASLVWYLEKRCSDFLALHAALSDGVTGGSEGDRIPKDRLPKPPTRTFGLSKLLPEKMEAIRRQQLVTYMQGLLSIPEAMGNRAVLSFLGLLSTSKNDLISLPSLKRRQGRTTYASYQCRAIPPPSSLPPSRESFMSFVCSLGVGNDALFEKRIGRQVGRRRAGREAQAQAPVPAPSPAEAGATANGSYGVTRSRGAATLTTATAPAPAPADQRSEVGSVGARRGQGCGGADGTGREAELTPGVEKSRYWEGNVIRKVERVSALEETARGGDVVLFRCRGLLSRLQRWILRSEWDHVGVVVSGGSSGRVELLESTQAGVRLHPLVDRIRAYHEQRFACRVAYRRLRCPNPAEARARLEAFARQAQGKAYGIILRFTRGPAAEPNPSMKSAFAPIPSSPSPTPAAIPPKSPHAPSSGPGSAASGDRKDGGVAAADDPEEAVSRPEIANHAGEAERGGGNAADVISGEETPLSSLAARNGKSKTPWPSPPHYGPYLCSQLVGAAFTEMGVVRGGGKRRRGGGWFWVLPSAFGQGGAMEQGLEAGVTLGEEILVDAHEPEVARAVLLSDVSEGSNGMVDYSSSHVYQQ